MMRKARQNHSDRSLRTVSLGITAGLAMLVLVVFATASWGMVSTYADPGILQDDLASDEATVRMAQALYPASPSDSITYTLYLPLIWNQYNWQGITEWTPWAFHNETVTELQAGPGPGQLWSITPTGLYHSANYGKTWERADAGLPWLPTFLALEDSLLPDAAVYAARWSGEVYVSHNSGASWTLDIDFEWPYLDFLDYAGGTLYAQTYSPYQLRQRLATGVWQPVGDPLDARVNDVAVFQSTVYVGTSTGLYRLAGNTWEPVTVDVNAALHQDQTEWISPELRPERQSQVEASLSGTEVHSLFVHDGMIFVSAAPRGLYKSTDGVTWTACDVGLTDAYSVTVWQMVASASGRLFAAAATDGVFVSDSQGERWQALDAGLPHSTVAYGVLLDGVAATTLTMVRDEGDEQTLGAVFNHEGVWFLTVTGDTLLADLPPKTPPKAVLVVGPVDPPAHTATKSYIAWADRLAAIMERNGVRVVKVYWPDSTWENVRQAIGGASIIVYKGHGFGLGDLPVDPTEMYGGLNGFCLVHPEEPAGARLGTQDMLVTTNRLAENAIGFFFCCYCAGSSGSDTSPVSEALARRRIEAYSSTVMRMGGGGYFSGANEEALLEDFFAYPDRTLGELYRNAGGDPDHVYPHVLWPDQTVWFDGDTLHGWGRAFAGDPDLTAQEILGH